MGGLNEGQAAAIEKITSFMEDPAARFFTLDGSAGTGKTYTITSYIRRWLTYCRLENMPLPRVYLSAPTHKAVSVIADLLETDSLQVDCGTLHSLLGLYLTANSELKQLADGGTHRLSDYTLIIADEGSMIGGNLFGKLEAKMSEGRFKAPKVIFLGDSMQLDPVKESASPVFKFTGATLTEQMRQINGNPIETLIARARTHVESKQPMAACDSSLNAEGDGVHVVKPAQFKDMILANFDTDEYREDSHYCKVLAWTNREVDKWNYIVRNHLLGKDADQIVQGEVLVLQGPVKDIEDRMIMHTEQEVTVTGLTTDFIEEEDFEHGHRKFKVWVVSGRTKDGIFGTFEVLHQDSQEDYDKYTKILRNAAMKNPREWSSYWQFCDQFISVRPPFACTVHKSQGSSFTNVFVSMSDIVKNGKVAERNRLIYVGLSRARQNIVLNTRRMS